MQPTTFTKAEDYGYVKKFELVAKMLEFESPNEATYKVENVYFDYGQDWMWTTIVRYGFRECQVLNPKEWEQIIFATDSRELLDIVEEIRNGDYFGDK